MNRALTPVVGVVLLLAVTVATAAVVAAAALAVEPSAPGPRASLSLTVSAADDRIALTHRGGDALDVRALSVVVTVDGAALDRQPPVPFFAARGFESGPTGPFNVAADPGWEAGETAALALASTNGPEIEPGDRVAVVVARGDRTVARTRGRG